MLPLPIFWAFATTYSIAKFLYTTCPSKVNFPATSLVLFTSLLAIKSCGWGNKKHDVFTFPLVPKHCLCQKLLWFLTAAASRRPFLVHVSVELGQINSRRKKMKFVTLEQIRHTDNKFHKKICMYLTVKLKLKQNKNPCQKSFGWCCRGSSQYTGKYEIPQFCSFFKKRENKMPKLLAETTMAAMKHCHNFVLLNLKVVL